MNPPKTVPRWILLGIGVLLVVTFVAIGGILREAERRTAANVEGRFRLRVEIAERFLHAYVEDILRRERIVAEGELSQASLREPDFVRVVQAFGFEAAVVVDRAGKLELVYPPRPEIIGKDVTTRYAHLRNALRHGFAVSSVVPSAALGAPVVGFATRYDSLQGPRVFSGAYDVTHTPLRAYLSNLTPVATSTVDLIDAAGVLVASSRSANTSKQLLRDVDAPLARAIHAHTAGEYDGDRSSRLFVTQPIGGTEWRLVAAVDIAALYKPFGGRSNWIGWLLFAAFFVALTIAAFLFWRLLESRYELRAMNEDLARLARVDRLTGLPNRLHLEEQLVRMRSAARRQEQPLSVFVVDVDHFKAINDTFGHLGGDEVLQALGQRMVAALRAEDMLGRWGGEEFLCVLPNTPHLHVSRVAERVRAAANHAPIALSSGRIVQLTVSIGCATLTPAQHDDDLVQRADDALYRAKQLGRDRVVASVASADPIASTRDPQSAATSSTLQARRSSTRSPL